MAALILRELRDHAVVPVVDLSPVVIDVGWMLEEPEHHHDAATAFAFSS